MRLILGATEILKTHDYHSYRPEREWLIEIRKGKYTLDELFDIIEDLDTKLKSAYETSTLREKTRLS